MFNATVENLASSISVVESCPRSSAFPSSSAGCDVAVDGVSNSPKGVTEGVDIDPDRSAALLDAGVSSSSRKSVSRESPETSSSASGLSLPESEADEQTKRFNTGSQNLTGSLNGRTKVGIVFFVIRDFSQFNGCRDVNSGHQE